MKFVTSQKVRINANKKRGKIFGFNLNMIFFQ